MKKRKKIVNIIIATSKKYNINDAMDFINYNENNCKLVFYKNNLQIQIQKFKPDIIFFVHWSYIIPFEIYNNYKCIVFHTADLPFGRGGSPIQNNIANGIYKTKISAIKVEKEIDSGDIYLKEDIELNGSLKEILKRISKIIFNIMIPKIIDGNYVLKKQVGKPSYFSRRKKEDGEIKEYFDINKIYDYIRMLDSGDDEYPRAYINFGDYQFNFSNANFKDKKIIATIEIKKI
jgi:methionyl-tRNA formyltransferase